MKSRKIRGQTAIEYVLLILVCTVVFGWLFYQIRRDLFRLWVCEIGPRVQSPVPCKDREECFARIGEVTTGRGRARLQNQINVCRSM